MTDSERAISLFERGQALHRSGELWAAVDCYRRSTEADPDVAATWNALGGALANLGETEAAVKAFKQAVAIDAKFFDPYFHLAKLWRIEGQLDRAEPLIRRALELDERNHPAWMEYGAIMMLQNRFDEAAKCFEKALAIEPDDANAFHNLGRVAFELGHEVRAVELYSKALFHNPDLAPCHTNLGLAHRALGEFERARASFEQALALQPLQAEALAGLVGMLELEGRYEEALEKLELAIKSSSNPLLQLSAARIERRLERPEVAIARLGKHVRRISDKDTRIQLEFLLGDLLDELGRYDEAWQHYCAGNKMKGVSFSASEWDHRVSEIIAAFPGRYTGQVADTLEQSARAVFIVGMPRSGTSLVEQIIASHSQVFGAGELTTLPMLVNEIPQRINGAPPYPQCMSALSRRRLTRLGEAYLAQLARLSSSSTRITDKMWQNFEYLGLIERMLPGARVIHCRRDPMDSSLSCFSQNFSGQTGVPFSYDLAHIGAFYRGYRRLMDHWHQVCGLPVFELDYESLVKAPTETIKALIEFLGLPWEEACLDFHNSRRMLNTASTAQIKEPIYTKSVARHHNYAQHLEPLRAALEG